MIPEEAETQGSLDLQASQYYHTMYPSLDTTQPRPHYPEFKKQQDLHELEASLVHIASSSQPGLQSKFHTYVSLAYIASSRPARLHSDTPLKKNVLKLLSE